MSKLVVAWVAVARTAAMRRNLYDLRMSSQDKLYTFQRLGVFEKDIDICSARSIVAAL